MDTKYNRCNKSFDKISDENWITSYQTFANIEIFVYKSIITLKQDYIFLFSNSKIVPNPLNLTFN